MGRMLGWQMLPARIVQHAPNSTVCTATESATQLKSSGYRQAHVHAWQAPHTAFCVQPPVPPHLTPTANTLAGLGSGCQHLHCQPVPTRSQVPIQTPSLVVQNNTLGGNTRAQSQNQALPPVALQHVTQHSVFQSSTAGRLHPKQSASVNTAQARTQQGCWPSPNFKHMPLRCASPSK